MIDTSITESGSPAVYSDGMLMPRTTEPRTRHSPSPGIGPLPLARWDLPRLATSCHWPRPRSRRGTGLAGRIQGGAGRPTHAGQRAVGLAAARDRSTPVIERAAAMLLSRRDSRRRSESAATPRRQRSVLCKLQTHSLALDAGGILRLDLRCAAPYIRRTASSRSSAALTGAGCSALFIGQSVEQRSRRQGRPTSQARNP